jgi:hypothetical protein
MVAQEVPRHSSGDQDPGGLRAAQEETLQGWKAAQSDRCYSHQVATVAGKRVLASDQEEHHLWQRGLLPWVNSLVPRGMGRTSGIGWPLGGCFCFCFACWRSTQGLVHAKHTLHH